MELVPEFRLAMNAAYNLGWRHAYLNGPHEGKLFYPNDEILYRLYMDGYEDYWKSKRKNKSDR